LTRHLSFGGKGTNNDSPHQTFLFAMNWQLDNAVL